MNNHNPSKVQEDDNHTIYLRHIKSNGEEMMRNVQFILAGLCQVKKNWDILHRNPNIPLKVGMDIQSHSNAVFNYI